MFDMTNSRLDQATWLPAQGGGRSTVSRSTSIMSKDFYLFEKCLLILNRPPPLAPKDLASCFRYSEGDDDAKWERASPMRERLLVLSLAFPEKPPGRLLAASLVRRRCHAMHGEYLPKTARSE